MGYDVNTVINIALAEEGYLEKASNKNLDSKTANAGSNNYTKYGKEMHQLYPSVMDFPAAWCDCFVDWCFMKAYGVSNAKGLLGGDFNDYTVASAKLYKDKNAYHYSDPKIGDQIFFNNGKRICHTGLVYKVDSSRVYTIEGNTSSASGVVANGGCVRCKSYPLTYYRIDGYGRPNYGTTVVNESTNKVIEQAAKPAPKPVNNNNIVGALDTVKEVQIWANKNYNAGLSVDGIFGPNTKKALVKIAQKIIGVNADGDFGPKSKAAWVTVRKGSKSKMVVVVQCMLICLGYSCGSAGADGDFGSGTYNAVITFQKAKGLTRDGIVGPATAYALFKK